MRYKIIIISLLCVILLNNNLFSQLSLIKNFSPKDYKAASQNWSVIQDNNGLIIVGNTTGVLIYDGVKWEIIQTPNTVRSLCVDSNNVIYLGLDSDIGVLDKAKNGLFTYKSLKNKIPDEFKDFTDIWSTLYFNNEIYFNALDRIYVFKNDTFEIIKPDSAKFFKGMSIIDNKIYTSEPLSGLKSISNHKVETLIGSDILAKKIYCILPYDNETLLIATRTDGLFLYSKNKNISNITDLNAGILNDYVSKPKKFSKIDSILMTDKLYNGIKISENQYCFTTVRNGIVIMDKNGNIEKQYNIDNGLIDNTCFDLLKDSNEQIWIVTSNGISLIYNNLPFDFYTLTNGIEGFVTTITLVENKLYVGTDKAFYVQNDDKNFSTITNSAGQNFISKYINNQLYIVNQDAGIMYINNDAATVLTDCKIGRPVFMFKSPFSKNEVWTASAENSIIEKGEIIDNKYIKKGIIEGIENKAYNFELDTINKILWFTDSPQLYKAQLDYNYDKALNVVKCDSTMGLPNSSGTPFSIDNQIFFATEAGIYKFNIQTNKFEKAAKFSMLTGQLNFTPLLKDRNGNIWFEEILSSGRSEKGYLKYNNGNYEVFKTPFYKFVSIGTSNYFCNNVELDSVKYLGTNDGLIAYYPNKQVNYDLPFNTIIRKINAKDSLVFSGALLNNEKHEKSKFTNNFNNLVFEYSCTFYEDAEKNLYRYRLIGLDTTWSDWVIDVKKEYTNLWEGNYTFEVQAKNIYEKTGKIASYSFKISPPWFRTYLAYMIYLILAIVFVYINVKFYTRQLVKKQEKELAKEREVSDKLRQLDKLKDEFIANTSHELRTPLNGIIGIAESLIEGATGQLPAKAIFNLNIIASSGRRLANLVNDILDFWKMRSKELQMNIKAIDLSSIVSVVLELSKPLAKGKDLEIINTIPSDISLVAGDENRIQQILLNVIGNAIKFTDKGKVEIGVFENNDNDNLTFYVSDTGIGIPKDKFEKVFLSFEQVDGSTAREYGGTGLGLAVTKQLLELQNGKIWLESELGKGSVFYFTLPKSSATEKENKDSDVDKSKNTIAPLNSNLEIEDIIPSNMSQVNDENSRFSILLVDDEPVNLQVLENQLSMLNYVVYRAENGFKALEIVNSGTKIDLIILDVMMPKMSGYEVATTLRKKFTTSALPIIMLTAKNQVTDLITAFENGANDYLTKPFNRAELVTRLKIHLQLLDINRNLEHKVIVRTEQINQQKEEILTINDQLVEKNEVLNQQKEEIQAQAEELFSKNEAIEKTYKNIQLLSEIGKEVTSSLDIKTIIDTVYENVNNLMDAAVFAIGIYNPQKNNLVFEGTKENGETLPLHFDSMANEKQLSVICFSQQKNIFIDNLSVQFKNYFDEMPVPTEGDITQSILYIPINAKDKKIGVISVQSFNNFAYNEHDINILENIAIYTAIALENADAYRQISGQKQIIEYQNEAIHGSIRYAQTIQNAILPNQEIIDKHFENFIILRPKDIVSGDFYWYTEIIRNDELGVMNDELGIRNYKLGIMNEKNILDSSINNSKFITNNSLTPNSFFIAVVDCTGHGVPGAFMSMIGNTLLNEIVNGKKIYDTAEILTNLHKHIVISLRQDDSENNDGMDVCFCRIDKFSNKIIVNFTGAKRPLLVYKQGDIELETIKGNRKSIGGTQKKLNVDEFTNQEIVFETEGIIYLSSDGFTDQNNVERKKFGPIKLNNMIIGNVDKPMKEQGLIYNQAIENWMNGEVQRDDISLIGIKIKI